MPREKPQSLFGQSYGSYSLPKDPEPDPAFTDSNATVKFRILQKNMWNHLWFLRSFFFNSLRITVLKLVLFSWEKITKMWRTKMFDDLSPSMHFFWKLNCSCNTGVRIRIQQWIWIYNPGFDQFCGSVFMWLYIIFGSNKVKACFGSVSTWCGSETLLRKLTVQL